MRGVLAAATASLVCLVGLGVAAAGEPPSVELSLDPEDAAHLVVRETAAPAGPRSFARGGVFAGDLDGDGTDELVLQAGLDASLELFFGDPELGRSGQEERSEDGDSSLLLPEGCRQGDDRVHYAPLGDLDGDGFDELGVACFDAAGPVGDGSYEGAFALYFGRPQPWGTSVAEPDLLILGSEVPDGGGDPLAAHRPGAEIAGAGDVDGDGFADFVVTGTAAENLEIPRAWFFHGSADIRSQLESLAEATWSLSGHATLRCLEPLVPTGLGDVDGDGLDELALGCPLSPPPSVLDPEEDNELDISLSVFLGSSLLVAPAGPLDFEARDVAWAAGVQRVPQAIPFAALGDVDGDGFGDFGVVSWFEAGGSLSGQVVRGHAAPWEDIALDTPYTPFLTSDSYNDPAGLQLAAAGSFPGGEGVWLRLGTGEQARVGLLSELDPADWVSLSEPPLAPVITSPGGVAITEDWRLGLGGVGDADGDGVPDLLVLGGFTDAECSPESCGGAWLILCGDLDGDGVSACAGDCDDADPSISPSVAEQCDTVDHDCNGEDGLSDVDGDGLLGCEGDCDDSDPGRRPGIEESCEDSVDLNCDGLVPLDDVDGDGSANCEDCQPWDPSLAPSLEESCDGLDNDCDGELPREEQDVDRDGWRACAEDGEEADCDDANPWIHPFRHEDCSNGVDDDCNGLIDEDSDADGDQVRTCEGDCRDSDPLVFPGAEELCDGLDNNCNGTIDDARDLDEDGSSPCQGDCDDGDPTVYPGAVGVCVAGLDSNCDGADDLLDADGDGFTACSGDCSELEPGVSPISQDYCDGRDDDCSGVIDQPWDVDGDSWATCLGDCADGDSSRYPRPEELDCLDGVDDDCDGLGDSEDPDCPPPDSSPELGPRPYGISCAGCGSSSGGGQGTPASPSLLTLLVLLAGLRLRRGHGRSSSRGVAGWLLLSVLALSLVALPGAAQAARKEPGLLVYRAPQPDLASMVEARQLAAAAQLEPRDVLHTSEFLEPLGPGLTVWDAAAVWTCPEGAQPPSPSEAVDRGLDALIELDHARAEVELSAALDRLSCLQSPLPQQILLDLFYYRALAHQAGGDWASADEDFRRVLAVQPSYPGDPNFPPEAGDRLERLRVEAADSELVSLHAYAPGQTEVRLDGKEWDPRSGPAEVLPGRHLVQYRQGSVTHSVVFDLGPRDRPTVVLAADRERAFRDCLVDPGARAWASSSLSLAALDVDVDVVALIDLTGSEGAVRWLYRVSIDRFSFEEGFHEQNGRRRSAARVPSRGDGATGRASGARSSSASSGAASPGSAPAVVARAGPGQGGASGGDRVRLRVSGGYSYLHPFSYLHVPVDFGVRLVAGLFADVGVQVGFAGPSDHGTVWLPSASLGLSYRFQTSVFQPRLGVLFRAALDSGLGEEGAIGARLGWAGQVGFDVLPPDSPLLIGLDVQGGMLGRPLWLSASAGVGLRF